LKTPEDRRVTYSFTATLYIEAVPAAQAFLEEHGITYQKILKQTFLRKPKKVFAVSLQPQDFTPFIRAFERATQHRVPLYNADILPEQQFLYQHDVKPCSAVQLPLHPLADTSIPLSEATLSVIPGEQISLRFNNKRLEGSEKEILEQFIVLFNRADPDVVKMDYAFSRLPYLIERLNAHNLFCPFHRWDPQRIKYRGGKTFYSYGQVRYRDFALRLHGRLLIDTSTVIGSQCTVDAIIELCQLSGMRFQQIASRSFGAVFQSALLRTMFRRGLLIPYKEKVINPPMTMFDMLKADRAGHTFDPQLGFHTNVAEIDFCSMFPWLIYNRNISADTILADKGPFVQVPDVPVTISLRHKGLVPLTIKPFIDRRMAYKKNPTALNKERAVGLKWVLVSSYGYLRFREFKLGLASSHMAICAYAREVLIAAARLAEQRGFTIVHGIVDSLYIKKPRMTEEEVKAFCDELETITGIPLSFEGIFKWLVLLPSINDPHRALPACYYGVFQHGAIKARGIEMRQRSVPLVVQEFQKNVIEQLRDCKTPKEIVALVPQLTRHVRKVMEKLPHLAPRWLACSIRLTKTTYKNNIPQRKILRDLRKKKVEVRPGQMIHYVYQRNGVVLPEEYHGDLDVAKYRKLLVRALYRVLQPFNVTKQRLYDLVADERQTKLHDFTMITFEYIPLRPTTTSRYGLSERQMRRRLERQGWTVWRGGSINMLRRNELYPNVRKKYQLLYELLEKYHPKHRETLEYFCSVHHGMPDFICFRHGTFKFVECKLGYEALSRRQKKCISRLQQLRFTVEVHKAVDHPTKLRSARVDIKSGEKVVMERQMILRTNPIAL